MISRSIAVILTGLNCTINPYARKLKKMYIKCTYNVASYLVYLGTTLGPLIELC